MQAKEPGECPGSAFTAATQLMNWKVHPCSSACSGVCVLQTGDAQQGAGTAATQPGYPKEFSPTTGWEVEPSALLCAFCLTDSVPCKQGSCSCTHLSGLNQSTLAGSGEQSLGRLAAQPLGCRMLLAPRVPNNRLK